MLVPVAWREGRHAGSVVKRLLQFCVLVHLLL